MYTYQDFVTDGAAEIAVAKAISVHKVCPDYQIAQSANEYDKQRNETILNYVKMIMSLSGRPLVDFSAANNKITSNFFRRLNTQRNTYSLGNGVTFSEDTIKDKLGPKFDTDLKRAGYLALIHGVSFGFWNVDRLHVFPYTEFAPLWDEDTGALMAGVRYWQLTPEKPLFAVLYEIDGYTKLRGESGTSDLKILASKTAYKQKVAYTPADGSAVVGGENYSSLPIVPLWGSELHQSTLVGMRTAIDSFDLIRSGFANDLTDCAQIYWIVSNCGGMDDNDLARLRDRLKLAHIAAVPSDDGAEIKSYAQEIPYSARTEYLKQIRSGIYEDFGGLDVHTVAAGATNDHIDAAYQPLDENADDFEYQVIEFVQGILALQGIEDTPIFKRNRISNELERTQMVLSAASYLDDETVLNKLPFITPDEIKTILQAKDAAEQERFDDKKLENLEGNEDDTDAHKAV